MSVPPTPSPDGAPSTQPGVPRPDGTPAPQWDVRTPDPAPAPLAWGPPQAWAPSWELPQAGGPLPPGSGFQVGSPGVPVQPPRGSAPWLLVLVAVAALLAGAAGAGLVSTALFASGAEEMGAQMAAQLAEEMAPRISEEVAEQVASSMDDALGEAMGGFTSEEMYPESDGPVEQFPPTEPGDLGPDPVLDDYADSCFDGDLQACDDLFYNAAPLSDYEEYAGTCGGRVKLFEVIYCTDLE